MTSIFINYRRNDTAWPANWLSEKLSPVFGSGAVFQDVREISAGDDFSVEIQQALEEASVLLVLIGTKWLFAHDESGRRRIDYEHDWVRREIRHGLASAVCRVIPVFLDNADVFRADALPEDIRGLAGLERINIRANHGDHDVGTLIEAIKPFVKQTSKHQGATRLTELGDETALAPPVFQQTVVRGELLKKLSTAMLENSVVTIGGLSGSGKTYLTASYLQQVAAVSHYQAVFWHDAVKDESVEDMLSLFSKVIQTEGYSVAARCKKLMTLLSDQNGLLVIDDLQKANVEAYAPLIRAAQGTPTPCRLILLSQTRVELDDVTTPPFHLDVEGWGYREVESLLKLKRLDDVSKYSHEIARQSGGLPFAVSLFCSLVRQYNYDPAVLLSGAMSQNARLKNWFTRIIEHLSESAKLLLPRLGLVDGQFNIGVVNELCGELEKNAFEQLQHSYLISSASPYRWKVHDLAAALSREYLSDRDAESIHKKLGKYFSRGLTSKRKFTEQEFFEAVRAYRHFRQSRASMAAGRQLLVGIAATAKLQGLYRLYADLSAEANTDGPGQDLWLDYHHAHCLQIMGYFNDTLQRLGSLRSNPALAATPHLALSVNRLYAEILGSLGRENEAMGALLDALGKYESTRKVDVPLAQANSVLVWLYIRLGRLDEAEDLNNLLLKNASLVDDPRGGAIALTKAGMIESKRGKYAEALSFLEHALELFTKQGDKRGSVWCVTHMSEVCLHLKDEQRALKLLARAQRGANDIEECGVDYRDVMARMQKLTGSPALRAIVDKELKRTGSGRKFRPRSPAHRD